MTVVFTCEDEPATQPRDYWRHVLGDVLGPLEPRGGNPDRLRVAEVGAVRVGDLLAHEPGGAERTRRHVRAIE
ncbi:MAG TPA: hypothetical protein VE442_02340, partial [Jatrophihabitans sp.]|nr:hypothetical protein [Jatrophihabitans sp.]